MDRKYQIFVSSTYEDLKDERNEVIKACLNMGHIPVGMEMFNAADEEQWAVIKRTIDQCDYYVVIVAHRYGSMTPEGISFTEKEYDYARQQGIPVLGFLIETSAAWPADRMEREPKAVKAVNAFKAKVKQKMVNFWSTGSELRALFNESINKTINLHPRRGWTRAPEGDSYDVAEAIAKLAQENDQLRRQLANQTTSDDEIKDICLLLGKRDVLGTEMRAIATASSIFVSIICPRIIQKQQINLDEICSAVGSCTQEIGTLLDDLVFYRVLSKSNNDVYHLTELGRRVMLKLSLGRALV